MNIRKTTGLMLAICLAGAMNAAQAQTTNSTGQILQRHTFREGLVWIGDKEPDEAENQELLAVLDHLDKPAWTAALEQFLKDHPQSPWAASLHYDYASFCRRTGRTTKALEHFEAAWTLAKIDPSPQGQRLGGTVLANWTDLLSSLGRSEQLKMLIAEGDTWHFVNPRDRDKFQGAKNSYELMQLHPGMAYRCGTFALKAAGGVMQPGNPALAGLVELPSPTNGFSLAGLADLAKQYGLDLVAVRRTAGQDLIVPSVVHWRQNHYAAILKRQGDLYQVSDPTFGNEKWLPAEVINEEASGEFLIPATLATNGWSRTSAWQELARTDAQTIHGMGLPNNINDGKDKSCSRSFSGQTVCTHCPGMPVWWVSEPYVNLWLADEPLSYLTSRGQPVTFQITYKQRDTRPSSGESLISTAGWNNSWASYVVLESDSPFVSPVVANSYATVYLPGGGEVDFNPGQNYDSETRLLLQQQCPELPLEGTADEGSAGLRLIHADGSQDIYGSEIGISVPYGDDPEDGFMLTRHLEPNGDTTWFQYDSVNLSEYVLTYVVDPDGRTNTLSYTANNLLSSVTNAYGLSAHFKYDSNGNLTNLVDAQGLSSSLTYATNGYPASLTTPYGTTTFSIFANATVASTNDGEGNFGGDDLIDRSVLVTDPVGANYLYMYRYDCSSASPVDMSPTYPSGDVPTNTPLGTLDNGNGSSTNTLAGVCYRNSFYWGPRQYPALSTNNQNSFTANDYLRGRMQHWLEDSNQLYLTGYVSAEQDASPDGSTPGLLTFYDYQGKQTGYNFCEGTNALPSVKAWRLPNGETHYEYLQFDYFGNITNDITTYTVSGGSLGTRTNQFIYADNTYTYTIGTWTGSSIINTASSSFTVPDLLNQVIGADGNTIWAYGGFDTVTWTNLFYAGGQTNGTTMASFRVLPDHATNGLGQIATSTFTLGGNPVTLYDMWPGTPSETNNFFGTPLATTFPGYSKITSTKSVAGLTTTNFYNASGFLAETIDLQVRRTNSFGYTTNGLIGSLTNELGLNLAATWDNLLRLTSIQFPDGTYISNLFNKLDLAGQQNRLGNWTYYGYDGARHLTSITNANNGVTQLSWCGCGALTGIIDALTNATTFNYDNQGNLTNVAYPDTSALNYQYDLATRPTSIADGAGRAIQLGYNNQGLVTTVSNAYGQVQGVFYDIRDRQAVVTDDNNITVTNGFDLLDRIVTRTWPDGISENYGFNAKGLAFYTNRDQQVTWYGRDVAGRLTAETNANLEVIQFAYNPADEITNLIDGLNHVTTFQFNQYGWLTNKVDGLGRTAFRYLYNPDGWLTNRWTPEKGDTGYAYDNVGNLKSIVYPQQTNSYAYDALNRLTNMVDAVGTNVFSYTPVGQLQSENGPWTNDTVTCTYVQGLRTVMSLSQPVGNWSQSYGYDSGWRMTNITSPAGMFKYGYGFQPASPLVTGISLPNGANITNNYDSLARLTQASLNNYWGHTLDGYSYGYDSLGLRTNIVRNLGLTASTVSASYDAINQLTGWTAKEAGGMARLNEQLGFGYDAAHNLHTRNNGNLAQTFTVDAANELTNVTRTGTFTESGATPAPATNVTVNGLAAQTYGDFTFARTNLTLANGQNSFTNIAQNVYGLLATNTLTLNLLSSVNLNFDNNGNLTNDGTRMFAFDAENQMTNVTVAGQWRSDFVYDGLNRRRIERDFGWQSSAWVLTNEIHFVYDGRLLIQERGTNNNPLVTYTRGLDLSDSLQNAGGIGGLLARTDMNGSTFFHADAVGNVTALMDGSENIVARYLQDPFGRLIGQWGSMGNANSMQASSMPRHWGIVFYPLRPELPDLDRFITADPIQETGGINLYRAVGNSPLNKIDPLGLIDPMELEPVVNEVDADAAVIIADIKPALDSGIKASEAEVSSLMQEARALYPKLCNKFQLHHPIPQYLNGPAGQNLVKLEAPYHQLITNAFRRLAPYGQQVPDSQSVQNIVNQVYSQYPLPK
jgi:RHS repeat-associated protein